MTPDTIELSAITRQNRLQCMHPVLETDWRDFVSSNLFLRPQSKFEACDIEETGIPARSLLQKAPGR